MIEIKDLSFSRGGKILFENANLTIFPQKKVGLVGSNGSGKSSFFSLLLHNDLPDNGDIRMPDKYIVAHVEQEISNQQESIINYVLQGDSQLFNVLNRIKQVEQDSDHSDLVNLYAQLDNLGGYNARHKGEILLAGLGFKATQMEDKVASLSGGWQMRLNLARALMCPSDLLLLDEPTNHLDLDTIIWLEEYLKAYSGTLIVISHDREFLDNVTNQIITISNKTLTLYNGNYSSYERQFAEKQQQQEVQAKKTERRINELTKFIDRFKAKASKAKQAQSRVKALNKLETITPFFARQAIQFNFLVPEKMPQTLLQLEQVNFNYGAKQVLKNVNLKVFANDRLGVLGVNGAGKSTLIKVVAGQNTPTSGDYVPHKDLVIGYFAQDFLEQLDVTLSAIAQYKIKFPMLTEQEIRNHLGSFGFSGDMALQPISQMSGGEKARLALSIIVFQKPNLLILDEPTNHLDLEVRESLTFALQSYEGALILVSHDRHLLENVCDEFYLMDEGNLNEFDGDLEDYRRFSQEKHKQQNTTSSSLPSESKTNKKTQRKDAADLRKKLQPLTSQIKKIEKELDELNQLNTELESILADAEIYSDSQKDRLKTTLEKKTSANLKISNLETRWMELNEELDALQSDS